MESRFKGLMEEDELDTFVRFSRAMGDLAEIFKVSKPEKSPDEKEKIALL